MTIVRRFGNVVVTVGVLAAAGTALMARQNRTVEQDRAGIERLHQQDLAATFQTRRTSWRTCGTTMPCESNRADQRR